MHHPVRDDESFQSSTINFFCLRPGPKSIPSSAQIPATASFSSLQLVHSPRESRKEVHIAILRDCLQNAMKAASFTFLLICILAFLNRRAHGLNFKIAPKETLCFHEITHKGMLFNILHYTTSLPQRLWIYLTKSDAYNR